MQTRYPCDKSWSRHQINSTRRSNVLSCDQVVQCERIVVPNISSNRSSLSSVECFAAFTMNEKLKSEVQDQLAIVRPNRSTRQMLSLSDTFFSLFVVAPLVVAHWYGAWAYIDQHADHFPPHSTFTFGILWHLLLILTRGSVYEAMKTSPESKPSLARTICKYFFVKLYLYVFSIGCITTWRSGFALLQMYLGEITHRFGSIANILYGNDYFRLGDSVDADLPHSRCSVFDCIQKLAQYVGTAVCHCEGHERVGIHSSHQIQIGRKYLGYRRPFTHWMQ